ncbi:MAG: hypothetical protein EPO11_08850 [Gammaproteobacteria bacterium]|nr:MAG: hypothetical protein EPO11_08850 [Gammaproteobacteria bacterium]
MGNGVVLLVGAITLMFAKIKNIECKGLVCILLGSIVSSLILTLLTIFFNIPAGFAFLYLSVFSLVIGGLIFSSNDLRATLIFSKSNREDYFILLFLIFFTISWCWKSAGSFPSLEKDGFLLTWVDSYLHGAQISQLFDPKAFGRGDIFLSGLPPVVYHRSEYMLAAVIAQAASVPGVLAATAFLLPIGVLLTGIAIFTVGTQLADRMTGIMATICILILPDSSWYWIKNGFLGFHYSLQVAPGTGYGLAVCLASFLFFIKWQKERSLNFLLLSLFTACSVFLFRVHYFVLYFPAILTAIALIFFGEKNKKYLKYSIIVFSILTILILSIQQINLLWLKHSAVLSFLNLVHLERGANGSAEFYKYVLDFHYNGLTIFVGILLLYLSILGIWMLLYPLLLYLKIKKFGYESIDYFTLSLSACYLGIILFAPRVYGLADELQHRPLGLLYAIVILFTVDYFLKLMDDKWYVFSFVLKYTFILSCLLGVACSILFSNSLLSKELFGGYSLYGDYQIPINSDLFKTALYFRDHSNPGDVFLTNKDDTDSRYIDSAAIIASVSGMPCYLGTKQVELIYSPPTRRNEIHRRETSVRQAVNDSFSRLEAFTLLRSNGISWFITDSPPKWDLSEKQSDFKFGNILGYHVQRDLKNLL